jgi:hypothetical protein
MFTLKFAAHSVIIRVRGKEIDKSGLVPLLAN